MPHPAWRIIRRPRCKAVDVLRVAFVWFEYFPAACAVRNNRADTVEELISEPEQPIAILFPVWRTGESLHRSLREFVTTLDYSSYHIFIGVCPNDTLSLREAQSLNTQFNHVHRVVAERMGPPEFSEALAVLLDGVGEYEMNTGIEFGGFVVADSDDSFHPLSLRLFNHGLRQHCLVQIPRYSVRESWTSLVAGSFHDELAMRHGRENELTAQISDEVSLPEVITCFSRDVHQRLLSEPWYQNDSSVERNRFFAWLHCVGQTRRFFRSSVDVGGRFRRRPAQARRDEATGFIAAMASFPSRFSQAVGYERSRLVEVNHALSLKSPGGAWLPRVYLRWRELSSRLVTVLVPIALFAAVLLAFLPDVAGTDRSVLSGLFQKMPGIQYGLLIALVYLGYRVVLQHVWVTGTYGLKTTAMILPRLLIGQVIRSTASFCSLNFSRKQSFDDGLQASIDSRARLGTSAIVHTTPAGERIGEMLRDRGLINSRDLQGALNTREKVSVPLGRILLRQGKVSESELLEVIAEQTGWATHAFDPDQIALAVTRLIPFGVIRRHRVLPVSVRIDGQVIVATYSIPAARVRRELELAAGAPVTFVLSKRSDVRSGISICARIYSRLDESTLIRYEDQSIGWVVDQLDPVQEANQSLQF